mmetsp:Transcript_90140/g.254193  ORF Transcript_90140/g.254193 Transcript_90140/m.254193 type:complete len:249 (-) Transcript_90140:373-1119(-)
MGRLRATARRRKSPHAQRSSARSRMRLCSGTTRLVHVRSRRQTPRLGARGMAWSRHWRPRAGKRAAFARNSAARLRWLRRRSSRRGARCRSCARSCKARRARASCCRSRSTCWPRTACRLVPLQGGAVVASGSRCACQPARWAWPRPALCQGLVALVFGNGGGRHRALRTALRLAPRRRRASTPRSRCQSLTEIAVRRRPRCVKGRKCQRVGAPMPRYAALRQVEVESRASEPEDVSPVRTCRTSPAP